MADATQIQVEEGQVTAATSVTAACHVPLRSRAALALTSPRTRTGDGTQFFCCNSRYVPRFKAYTRHWLVNQQTTFIH